MPAPIQQSAANLDLSPRIVSTGTVVGSPADRSETVVATLELAADIAAVSGVWLTGWIAYQPGTGATSANIRLRQNNLSGPVLSGTGPLPVTAGQNQATPVSAFDHGAAMPSSYVLTLQVASASGTSTVSGVTLGAMIV